MAVFCGFVSFCNAHEKQQVFMQTVKCVVVCVWLCMCVWLCVCVCVCVKERERGRESSLEIHYTSTKVFVVFFSRGKGSVPRQLGGQFDKL